MLFLVCFLQKVYLPTHIRWNPFHPAIDFSFVTSVHFISIVVQFGSAFLNLIQHVTLVTDSCVPRAGHTEAELGEPQNFARVLRRYLREKNLERHMKLDRFPFGKNFLIWFQFEGSR